MSKGFPLPSSRRAELAADERTFEGPRGKLKAHMARLPRVEHCEGSSGRAKGIKARDQRQSQSERLCSRASVLLTLEALEQTLKALEVRHGVARRIRPSCYVFHC